MASSRHLGPIEVDRIFLYEENPRHEPLESQPEIIDHLCKDEQVYNLARSISDSGTNPLELLGVVQVEGSGASGSKKVYQTWEGNRRLCAIKLLNDPDLAPAHLRKDFARLAADSDELPIKEMICVLFNDHDELRFWMGIIHNGPQSGVGRVDWNADQKARHFGSNRNKLALAILDAAQSLDLIDKDDRQGRLTTVQRFLNRDIVKDALGIDASNLDDITVNRPHEDFQKQLNRFIADVKDGSLVNSRKNQAQADAYGRKLARNRGISGERIEPVSLKTAVAAAPAKKSKRKTSPKEPRSPAHLDYDKDLGLALENIRSDKLDSLYYSICSVAIKHNTPLLTIGLWAFIESLTALAGKKDSVDFVGFCSNERLATHGFGRGKTGPIRDALGRIQKNGNATKHHEIAASFDGPQLANDLATVTPLLTKIAETIAPKK